MLYLQAALAAAALALVGARGIAAEPGPEVWIGLAQMLSFLVGGILLLCWVHRANANARALGARDMIVTPGWAVGWWFVPLANLVMPFATVREIWKASARPADWEAEPWPKSIAFWWGLWLFSGFSGIVSFQLLWAGDKQAFAASGWFLAASDATFVPAAVLLAQIIGGVEAMQRRAIALEAVRS